MRRREEDRIASAAASCLLRYALCDTKNASFCDAPIVWEGKPHFADSEIPLYFNLSHTVDKSRGMLAAAVLLSDEDEVGVDIEFVRPIRCRDALMRRLFTSDEQDHVKISEDECAFFDIWCAKEAFIKWTGEGFSRPLSSVSINMTEMTANSGDLFCDLRWISLGGCILCAAGKNLPRELCAVAVVPEDLIPK